MKWDLLKVFNKFYAMVKLTNQIYIFLLLMRLNIYTVKDFTPTSLVTRLYKIIVKALVNRMQKLFQTPTQLLLIRCLLSWKENPQ